MSPSPRQEDLRKIPSVDEALSQPEVSDLLKTYPRNVVVEAIRSCLKGLREELLHPEGPSEVDAFFFSLDRLYPLLQKELEHKTRPRLQRVINATGVVIHTNLGRSPFTPLPFNT